MILPNGDTYNVPDGVITIFDRWKNTVEFRPSSACYDSDCVTVSLAQQSPELDDLLARLDDAVKKMGRDPIA